MPAAEMIRVEEGTLWVNVEPAPDAKDKLQLGRVMFGVERDESEELYKVEVTPTPITRRAELSNGQGQVKQKLYVFQILFVSKMDDTDDIPEILAKSTIQKAPASVQGSEPDPAPNDSRIIKP